MSLEKSFLSKYSKKENEILSVKNIVILSVKKLAGVSIEANEIHIKENTATLQVSSVMKSVIFERKTEIEKDLRDKNNSVIQIQ